MNDNRVLTKFAEDIETEITTRINEDYSEDTNYLFREQVFTSYILENLSELGAAEDAQICFLEKKYGRSEMRINAWNANEDTGQVLLVATLYDNIDLLRNIPKTTLLKSVEKAVRVFLAAKNDYHLEMEQSSEAYNMMQRLNELSDSVLDIHVLLLTNGISATNKLSIKPLKSIPHIRCDIWDLVRLERRFTTGQTYETIEINFEKFPDGGLPCLKMPESEADYDVYLAIIAGNLLYTLYEEYGPQLLELNVRSFLQATGKVNKGIRDTIRNEPVRFLAYNNGISATAENLTVKNNGNGHLEITSVKGLQVVNGGQTMASIHRARKLDKTELDSVYVQAKITVVPAERNQEFVPKISRYANTQNNVNEADFSSNHDFHVEIDRLSQKTWCPGEQSRWFYERVRGQYQVARSRKGTTPAQKKKFDASTPRSHKFGKTDLAKYLNAWDQLPHIVSLGSQKNYVFFMNTLIEEHDEEWLPDENFYKELIAKAIIFKKTESIARQHKFSAYRANAISYTVSLLSLNCDDTIDLMDIWNQQEVPDDIADTMYEWMPEIWQELVDSAQKRNVTEWCKKEECWNSIKNLDLEIPAEE